MNYAKQDTDPVSVISDGSSYADSETAVFVVKGKDNIDYFRRRCEWRGLLTPGKPIAP
jgi:thiamine biosynthesis lipoprotein ApbE